MTVLTIRTDKPEAEVGLYEDNKQLSYITWLAHRELSNTIHFKLQILLEENGLKWHNIKGLVFYEGPGSFTGLRIGASVANALGLNLDISIVNAGGEAWVSEGIKLLLGGENKLAIPIYGGEANITLPRSYK